MKKVIVTFLYDDEGKSDTYYRELAFNEIYHSDSNLQDKDFKVETINNKGV